MILGFLEFFVVFFRSLEFFFNFENDRFKFGLCFGVCVLENFLAFRLFYLEDGDLGIVDVVEVDGIFEGVVFFCGVVGVVLVLVDIGGVVGVVVGFVV